MPEPVSEDLDSESVEVLRERLSSMKRLMAEQRNSQKSSSTASTEEIWSRARRSSTGIIDGNFLSFAFGATLIGIISVAFYIFYSLYQAVLKKFPSQHTEL
ncbi:uncharacterized protein LOC129941650 [Eupeodes corollae]|uniref:uncharacterized protein LOC129941650 n=1 Tax=Eupeodes corollae TaxID=290404 RepID=UPI002490C486|nr:uncharacterized protein LOC129941650 [Eupeodes corollae]